jgi:hypothetical protein
MSNKALGVIVRASPLIVVLAILPSVARAPGDFLKNPTRARERHEKGFFFPG